MKPTSVAFLLFSLLIILFFFFYHVLVVTFGGNRLGGHVINTMEFWHKYSRAQHSGVCNYHSTLLIMQDNRHGYAVSQQHFYYSLKEHDLVFWFGDLNYRINVSLSVEEVFDHILNGKLDSLRLCSSITNTYTYSCGTASAQNISV